jgi:hypothetical protein
VVTKTARAWKVKELLRSFWMCEDEDDATAYFKAWRRDAMATRLEPVKKVVRMLKSHWDNIITYFRRHLCNAAAEGINSRIQQLIQQACGYRNRDRFKRDVLFHLGGLDLHPRDCSMKNPPLFPEGPFFSLKAMIPVVNTGGRIIGLGVPVVGSA